MISQRHAFFGPAALMCAVLAAALWCGPWLARPDLYANDAAQHIFWLYRYADPTLFPGDLSARFFGLVSSAPWGYRALYAAVAPWVDVLFAAKALAALLVLTTAWLGWRIGAALVSEEGIGGFLGAAAAVWLIPQHADLLTPLALQRSFAFPIVLLFLWALIARRYFWVGVAWLLAALLYPVVIVVLGVTGIISLLLDTARDRRLPQWWAWNVLAGLAAVAIAMVCSRVPPDIGPAVTGHEALTMPEFGMHGRLRLFAGSTMGDWVQSQLLGLGWPLGRLLLIAAAAGLCLFLDGRRGLPRAAWVFLGSGIAVWLLSRATLFALYLPNRHARWTLGAFAVVAFSRAGTLIIERLVRRLSGRAALAAVRAAILLGIAMVVAAYVKPAWQVWHRPADADLERAYAFLATLPKNTRVVAHPDLADFVPLRAQRPVLASTETSLPFMRGYYSRLVPRLADSLRVAYATSWDDIDRTLAPYGATVVLTGPLVWQEDSYYAPFDALVSGLRARARKDGFVLQHPQDSRVLFRSGEVYVVRVREAQAR